MAICRFFGSCAGILRVAGTVCSVLFGVVAVASDDAPASAIVPLNRVVVGPHDWLTKHPTIQRLVQLTNNHRASMGLGPVMLDTEMCLAAQRHAQWMASTGAYQHSSLPYMEIIFQGPANAEAAVQGWTYSPAHNGIMLSGATSVGFGYALRGGYPYWVGVFR